MEKKKDAVTLHNKINGHIERVKENFFLKKICVINVSSDWSDGRNGNSHDIVVKKLK